MRGLLRKIIFLFILTSFTLPGEACRFTVREIGFSVLSETLYPILIVDGSLQFENPVFQKLKKSGKESNLKVQLLNPEEDAAHPLLVKAREMGISFPNVLFCTPSDELYPLFEEGKYRFDTFESIFYNQILQSPLRKKLLADVSETFAYIINIPGKDKTQNEKVMYQIREACKRIADVMPLMPKTVKNPPAVLNVNRTDRDAEKFLLFSLGFKNMPEEPYVAIVYGRGRFMGAPLNLNDIEKDLIYKYLAMIGADCECNLDRKWMLGTQIPLFWNDDTRQRLAKSLTFDVDNPMILAEMSRILSKEEVTGSGTTSFTPETIDLDEVFNTPEVEEPIKEEEESLMPGVLIATLVVLLVIAIFVSVYILRKSRS